MELPYLTTQRYRHLSLPSGTLKTSSKIRSYIQGPFIIEAVDTTLTTWDQILQLLRSKLTKAQAKMKYQADKYRFDMVIDVGD